MYTQLPNEIVEAISYEVGRNDLDCSDNYRAYRHKDGYLEREYYDAMDEGCCGYFDVNYTDDNGDVWTIGCNYGH
jgi:hypothetical protein